MPQFEMFGFLRQKFWKLLFFFSWSPAVCCQRKLNNVIRLDSFLQVTALDLIKHEEFSQLDHLLRQEFRPLARLLLLLGWTHCRSLSSARALLSVLHLEQVSAAAAAQQPRRTQTRHCHRLC